MKKLLTLPILALGLAGCGNLDRLNTNCTYQYALTKWPDGTVKRIEIKNWIDYANDDGIQIISTDGNIYLLSMNNTVLVRERK